MSSSRLETIVMHDGRLNVLCCLLDGGPLSVPRLSARIGESSRTVRYWVSLLDSFGLVQTLGDLDGGEPLYAVTVDDHPDWVRETIEAHRAARQS
jgi:predicted transcriptional regulator